jgi:L-alanine-DL-glutamate epimerase-like enolase superfamily enzyme
VTYHLQHETLRIPFRDPFRIARSHDDKAATTVIVELRSDRLPGMVGFGEGFPQAYYGETPETMATVFPLLLAAIADVEPSPDGLIAASAAMDAALGHHGAAKCALDVALHDLTGKVLGQPVHELLGLSDDVPPTDFTIGLGEPAIVAERARLAAGFPALKIKVGGSSDLATLEAVRAVFDGPIRVDANTAWTPALAIGLMPELERLGVQLIEQPFPARRLDWLRDLQARSVLPIIADESALTIDDLDVLAGVVAGVNVKLAKCGGVGPAKRMLERARELGLRTFLGCMEETTVGIAAAAAVASLAEWVDLDGNLLLVDDPFDGLRLGEDCRWRLSERPGLGVFRRSAKG